MAYFSHEKLKTKSTADTKAIVQPEPEPEPADLRIFRRKDNNIRQAIIFHKKSFIFNTN